MISAVILTEANRLVGYSIKGHAGYAKLGEDIVCAAVSTISQSVMFALDDLGEITYCSTESGSMDVLSTGVSECSQVLLKMLHNTLVEIQKQYPDHLEQVTIELYEGGDEFEDSRRNELATNGVPPVEDGRT